jgi:hypothetical protein
MAIFVLITCVRKKLSYKAKAIDMYTSSFFRMNLQYAQQFSPKNIFILSAKHGLLQLDEEIEPYDMTLNRMSESEQKAWALKVVFQLEEHCNLREDHFVILASKKYRQYLVPYLKSYEVPMAGFPIWKQYQFLRERLKGEQKGSPYKSD